MFEHHKQPLVPHKAFTRRILLCSTISVCAVTLMTAIGSLGFVWLEQYHLVDAFLNTALYLSGIGSDYPIRTEAGKLFAAIYALTCPFVSTGAVGVFFLPFIHRFIHKFHLDKGSKSQL